MSREFLSKREKQILKHLKEGLWNEEMAKSMKISCKTVSTYKARLRSKLGIKTKANAYIIVTTAQKKGLIS